jgi:hypothetical protein
MKSVPALLRDRSIGRQSGHDHHPQRPRIRRNGEEVMTELDLNDDDALRFVQRVLESIPTQQDREKARQLIVAIRTRVLVRVRKPATFTRETQEQIASVMLQHGTPTQQEEAMTKIYFDPDRDPWGATAPKSSVKIEPKDHPDAALVWSDCELRWINDRIAQAVAEERKRCAKLSKLAKAVLDTHEAEAKAAAAFENAQTNYDNCDPEEAAYEAAMIAASTAEKALREALERASDG